VPPAPLRRVFSEMYAKNGRLSERQAATLVNKSESRFRHIFSELTGYTFQTVRLRIKLSCGADLLVKTELSIPQISDLLDYSTRANFERAFTAVFAITPTQYRSNHTRKK